MKIHTTILMCLILKIISGDNTFITYLKINKHISTLEEQSCSGYKNKKLYLLFQKLFINILYIKN